MFALDDGLVAGVVADRSGALANDGAATVASWLRRNSTLTASQANGRAKLARHLPDLPVIAVAFAAGDLGVSHVTHGSALASWASRSSPAAWAGAQRVAAHH